MKALATIGTGFSAGVLGYFVGVVLAACTPAERAETARDFVNCAASAVVAELDGAPVRDAGAEQ